MALASPRGFAAAALAVVLLAPRLSRGGELNVSPVLVELDAARRSALVSIRNTSQAPSRYEVRAYTWSQDAKGTMQLEQAKDLVVFPPLLELAPGEERNLRIGTSAVPAATERSYRIFVEELPAPERPNTPKQIRVLTRVGVPVFFAPTRTERRGEAAFVTAGAGQVSIRLRNTGTVRMRPTAVVVFGVDVGGERTFEIPLDPWYVLAGDERFYEAALPPGACASTRELRATVQVEPAPIETRLLLPEGACAR
jgi:fimbrial chaperone protein